MDNFKFNFLSQGHDEKFFLTVFKILPFHEVFWLFNFLPLLLECSAEFILSVFFKYFDVSYRKM